MDGLERRTTYPAGMYPEQLPTWLTWATTWAGRRAPDTTKPFRYLDLGCGIGLTACWVKRCHPHAEVVGIDADPAHIEASRRLAEQLDVDVTFRCGTFEDAGDVGPVHFAVAHGVWSWVDHPTRASLVAVLERVLAPRGLFYVDYNALPGRSDWTALAGLLRTLVPHTGAATDAQALEAALEAVSAMEGTGVFARRPGLTDGLLDALRQQPGYLVHEFLSGAWEANHLSQVAADLAAAGLAYVSSAHLWEAVEPFRTTDTERTHLEPWTDAVVRHTVRDALRDTVFRHDVFQRGEGELSVPERLNALLARYYALGRPPEACSLDRPGNGGHPLPDALGAVIGALDGPPQSGEALQADLGTPREELVDQLGLLCAAGYVFPADQQLFTRPVDDLMAGDTDLLPLLSPTGLEVTFTRVDRAIWRALGEEDVVGSALAHLAAEGHRLPTRDDTVEAQRIAMGAQIDAFRATIPDMVRAGWSF